MFTPPTRPEDAVPPVVDASRSKPPVSLNDQVLRGLSLGTHGLHTPSNYEELIERLTSSTECNAQQLNQLVVITKSNFSQVLRRLRGLEERVQGLEEDNTRLELENERLKMQLN